MFNDECPCFIQQGKETQLLHVFEENLIFGNERTEDIEETSNAPSGIFTVEKMWQIFLLFFHCLNQQYLLCFCFLLVSGQPTFSARFFLVVVELTPTGRSLLHMWHLQLTARPVILG